MAEQIGDFEVEVRLALGKLSKQLAEANRRAEKSARKVDGAFAAVGRRVAALGLTFKSAQFVKQTLAWADATTEVADRLGLTVEEVQELQLIADRTNTPFNQLTIAVQRFARRLAEARKGGGEALDTLQAIGALDQEFDSTNEAFQFALDRLNEIEDDGQRVLATFKLFDSEGVQAVNRVRGSFRQLSADIRESGEILSREQVADVAEWERAVTIAVSKASTSLRSTFVDAVGSAIVAWGELQDLFGVENSLNTLQVRLSQVNNLIEQQTARVLKLTAGSAEWIRQVELLNTLAQQRLALGTRIRELGGVPGAERLTDSLGGGPGLDIGTDTEKEKADRDKALDSFREFQRDLTRAVAEAADDRVTIAELERDERLEALQEFVDAGVATEAEAAQARQQILVEYVDATTEELEDLDSAFETVAERGVDALGSAITDLATSGEADFKRLGLAFARFVSQIVARQALLQGIGALGSSIGGQVGGILTNIAGALADGGTAFAGRTYLVGERGPELFTPGITGAVTANEAMGGANVTIINNTGAPTETRDTATGIEVIVGAVADDIGRGGLVAQATQARYGVQPTGRRG